MSWIRVANVSHVAGVPYIGLKDFDFVRYEENTSTENARKLHEGEVDLALITPAEYAVHGGYIGFDFGVGCKEKSDTMMLYSSCPIKDIRAIHVYERASSSVILLRTLLAHHWKISPALIREDRQSLDLLKFVKGRDAALVLHDIPKPFWEEFPVAMDLVSEWVAATGKPFVSLIWAMRQGALRPDQMCFLQEAMHRFVKARMVLADASAEERAIDLELVRHYVSTTREYYLDSVMQDGLESFLKIASDCGIIPKSKFKSATLTLLNRAVPSRRQERSLDEVLEGTLAGQRLAIRDALRLAYESPLADLAMVAETVRTRYSPVRKIRRVFTIPEPEVCDDERSVIHYVIDQFKNHAREGVEYCRLPSLPILGGDPALWELLLKELRGLAKVPIEALSVYELRWMSIFNREPIEEIVKRLTSAGLDMVSGDGGEMLIERVSDEPLPGFLSIADWLATVRAIHSYGASTSAAMRVHALDSWEDRILHLSKLRALQDETPGFHSFSIIHSHIDSAMSGNIETCLRASTLSRLFLDNFRTFEERDLHNQPSIAGVLGCSMGEDSVAVLAQSDETIDILKRLQTLGMDFDIPKVVKIDA